MSGIDDLVRGRTWLVQWHGDEVDAMLEGWARGEDEVWPTVDRHPDRVRCEDLVLFWRAGPGDRAGVIGAGLASGEVEERRHPRSFRRPDGPRVPRPSAQVFLAVASSTPFVGRTDLRGHPAFADFDLFRMPNRPNLFEVSPDQARVVLEAVERRLQA